MSCKPQSLDANGILLGSFKQEEMSILIERISDLIPIAIAKETIEKTA
jgi:hypothetical protein